MSIVIDASVALKWVIDEEDSGAARALLADEVLSAPDLLFVECANVLWAKARRRQIARADARAALAAIEATPIRAFPARAHAAAALAMASELDQTAYDCLYLAVAIAERATLVTGDDAFIRAVAAHPVYKSSIAPLAGRSSRR